MAAPMVDYALKYAEMGFDVFPVKPHDKTPLVKWADEASHDAAKVKALWAAHPDANIGIATGKRSGIFVLDIDAGHGGEQSLLQLMIDWGKLPVTPISKTGGGGRHFIFSHPGVEVRNSAGKLGAGIDTRGDGGYIVAPPSIHPNGTRYAWDNAALISTTPLAPPPSWLINLLTRPEPPEPPDEGRVIGENVYITGQRNSAMTSLAGTMRRRGMTEAAIYTALVAENAARCQPPLGDDELKKLVASVFRYEPNHEAEPNASTQAERQRFEVEWLFAGCAYAIPEQAQSYSWLKPSMIADRQVSAFWAMLLETGNKTQAAAESGTIDRLSKSAQAGPIGEYAAQIARFGYLSDVTKALRDVQKFSEIGDVSKVQQIIGQLSDIGPNSSAAPQTATDGLMELSASLADERDVIKTKIQNLDAQIGGLERKTLSLIAARPSVGKTTLAFQIARNVAMSKKRALIFSLEVAAIKLWRKAALGIAEVSAADIMTGRISQDILDRLSSEIIPSMADAYGDNLLVYDGLASLETIWQMTKKVAPDLVVIDLLDYIDEKADSQVLRLGNISKSLKKLAKNANCHVMGIHQLNRQVEGRENKMPQLSDLRDSGHLEQDADLVLMPYRPDYYEITDSKKRYSETHLLIRKNRDGGSGVPVALFFDLLHQWFYRREELPFNYEMVKL